MSKLGNTNSRHKVIRALRRAGFVDSVGSKHVVMHHSDGRFTTIPNARKLNIHTLKAILKQCGLSEDEFLELY